MEGPPKADTDALIEKLQMEFLDRGVIVQRGSETDTRFDLRRPCGIANLDIATGGGLPAGGLSQIDGPEGVGKNLLVNRYFAKAQENYGDDFRGFMLCLEYPFDKKYALSCGFKVPCSPYEVEVEQRSRAANKDELLTDAEIKEMTTAPGKFYISRGPESEALLDIAAGCIDSNQFQIGAIDSWDAMLTEPEREADLADDARIARAATVQTQWMKKVQAALAPRKLCPDCFNENLVYKRHGRGISIKCADAKCGWKASKKSRVFLEENETTVIGIRQARANLSAGMYGRPWKTGGAFALKHGKLIDIGLRKGQFLKDGKVKIGKEVIWELTKGKAGTHEGPTGPFQYFFDPPEVDEATVLRAVAMTLGVIEYVKPKYIVHGHDMTFSSKEKVQRELEEMDDVYDTILQLCYIKAGLGHVRFV
jgi:RecA/RadA recombinase